jgi:hypothetical protein
MVHHKVRNTLMAAQGNILTVRILAFDKVYNKVRPHVDGIHSDGGRIALDKCMIQENTLGSSPQLPIVTVVSKIVQYTGQWPK